MFFLKTNAKRFTIAVFTSITENVQTKCAWSIIWKLENIHLCQITRLSWSHLGPCFSGPVMFIIFFHVSLTPSRRTSLGLLLHLKYIIFYLLSSNQDVLQCMFSYYMTKEQRAPLSYTWKLCSTFRIIFHSVVASYFSCLWYFQQSLENLNLNCFQILSDLLVHISGVISHSSTGV